MYDARGGETMLNQGSGIKYPWLKNKIDKALLVIQEWLDLCNYQVYCSISGGKDSLVASHLIRQIFPDIPLVWVNQGYLAEWEDCIELIYEWKSQGANVIELCPVRDLWHLYMDIGIPLEGTMDTKKDKLINQKLMYDPLQEYQELNQIKGYAWGIRKQESKGRAMYLKKHGLIHANKKDGLIVCSPIGHFSTQEIWQYIDANQLKYPAMYDQNRNTVRNGPPIGTTGINWGRLADLRKHYPNIYNEFVTSFPGLSCYV
jgi:3'-phosphoadenosine 5'-phosphosulfate sulfotransferase (PAPS reductase)/FAD synthetase